jgi:polyhydroxyalkanoate synthase
MKTIDADRLVNTFGNIPADLMNFGFLLLNPARLMIDKYVGFLENVDNKSFVENFVRMEKWIFDSPDVPGETFRQFVNDCYKKNLLIQSKMELGGKRVDLKKITMPVLNFYGMFDHLVPPAACEQLTKHVGSRDTEDVKLDTGHIGIYVSSKCQRDFAPKIAKWLMERDKPDVVRPAEKPSVRKPNPHKSMEAKGQQVMTRIIKKKTTKKKRIKTPPTTVKKMAVKGKPSLAQLISETI